MHIRTLTKKIEIDHIFEDQWYYPIHKHMHYELLYISKGKGQHTINDQSYNYKEGDLFILTPQDYHFFLFHEKSSICVIKFNENYFESFLQDDEFKLLLSQLILPKRKILLSVECKKNIGGLIELIEKEYKKSSALQNIIIKNSLSLIMALMSEEENLVLATPKDERIQSVLNYIDRHIMDKHLLSIQNIAEEFNINKNYFNQYFRKATGSSFKKYIQTYALNLVAYRLVHQDRTLSQLAFDFGYSDESHLSNAFKTHFNQTPSAFKKEHRKSGSLL
ncbi:AraC family transcriptional regulator [uncultured Bacteroides sp.]|uniref:AraC family transcriptional regulator n=1 Tax=uncultured Bacteroides sp. TaxID=162156 RepID=UPI002AA7DDBE|nr:AraC family transcriptional regulator [uncultured Bacteroides sp.]